MKVTPYVRGELARRRLERDFERWGAQGWKQMTWEPWTIGVPHEGSVRIEISNKFYLYWWRPVE